MAGERSSRMVMAATLTPGPWRQAASADHHAAASRARSGDRVSKVGAAEARAVQSAKSMARPRCEEVVAYLQSIYGTRRWRGPVIGCCVRPGRARTLVLAGRAYQPPRTKSQIGWTLAPGAAVGQEAQQDPGPVEVQLNGSCTVRSPRVKAASAHACRVTRSSGRMAWVPARAEPMTTTSLRSRSMVGARGRGVGHHHPVAVSRTRCGRRPRSSTRRRCRRRG